MTTSSRRTFLRYSAIGLGALAALPALRRGRAIAAPGASARCRRVLVLNLFGGARSSAAFHAAVDNAPYNPYGVIRDTGTPFALGRILDDTPPGQPPLGDEAYTLGGGWGGARVSRLREIAGAFSVLGTWSMARGDHLRARLEEPSGDPSGAEPGLLTRIGAGLAAARGGDLPVPPFHVFPLGRFGGGDGTLTRHVPVSLASWQSVPSAATIDLVAEAATGRDWTPAGAAGELMRDRFDIARVAARAGLGKQLVETAQLHRRGARTIGQRLAQDDFAVGDPDRAAASLGTVDVGGGPRPLTNGMLADLFLRCLGPDAFYADLYRDLALDMALAIRMLQIDSPAVTVELGNFDFHSAERTMGPALYGLLGRTWAALHWLLSRIPDPSGEGSMLDRTLVFTMSDFGRDRAGPSGWNDGDGSDHGADYACFYLAHAMMGAGVRGGRLVGGVRTDTYDARGEALQVTPPQLLVTALHALGLDPHDDDYGFPEGGRVVEELWQ